MRKKTKTRPNQKEPRTQLVNGNWYWKADKSIRPHFQGQALGGDYSAAMAEARRLNGLVDVWRAARVASGETPKKIRRRGPETVGSLIVAYKNSANWKLLRPRTQVQYIYEFKRLENEFGHENAATLDESRVDDWWDQMRLTAPETGRHIAAKGRLLYTWAGRKKLVSRQINPFKGLKIGQGKKRSMRLLPDDLRAMVAACDAAGKPSIGTALVIAFACVQRITDVLVLQEQHFEGGRLRFTQSKSSHMGARGVLLPGFQVDMETPAIVAERLFERPPKWSPSRWIIANEHGSKFWNERTVSRRFGAIRAQLVASDRKWRHLKDAQLRDGRRSGFVQYVLDGASVPFVCSMSGHSIEEGMQIIEHYLPKTADQADRAVKLLSVRL